MQTPSYTIDNSPLERDPAWFEHDIACAVADYSEHFDRDNFVNAISNILARHGIEAVDMRAFDRAA